MIVHGQERKTIGLWININSDKHEARNWQIENKAARSYSWMNVLIGWDPGTAAWSIGDTCGYYKKISVFVIRIKGIWTWNGQVERQVESWKGVAKPSRRGNFNQTAIYGNQLEDTPNTIAFEAPWYSRCFCYRLKRPLGITYQEQKRSSRVHLESYLFITVGSAPFIRWQGWQKENNILHFSALALEWRLEVYLLLVSSLIRTMEYKAQSTRSIIPM